MSRLSKFLVAGLVAITACGDDNKGKPDAAAPDAAPDAALPPGITEAKGAADGAGLDLKINFVQVTYVKPAVIGATTDPPGFTIQSDKMGPGLFIAVDPATLTPVPAVGDTVSFTITELGTVGMQKRALAISSFSRSNTGFDLDSLAVDVSSATDLVTALDTYESRLVDVTASLVGTFGGSGGGFQRSLITTAGFPAQDTNLQLRVPATLLADVDMVTGCQVVAKHVPMGRFNAQAQFGVFSASDVTLSGCAAPEIAVDGVAPLSATSLRITFTRHIAPASVVANGSQFTFDNGLTASAATVSGKTVTVTTSAQAGGTNYGLTVATSVKDLQGTGLAAPATGTFPGFAQPAVVKINEVNANITGGCDLIELRVMAGGSMSGFKIQERTGLTGELAFTFPAGFSVATNDFVVIHLNSGNATCNPNAATQETTAPNQQPAATFAGNFDTAYDFWNIDTGLTATDNVFTLFDGTAAITDALFASDDPAGATAAAATETAAAAVGAASQWDPVLATYIDTVFRTNAADDLNLTGTTAAGTSIQRLNNGDTNNKADWTTGAGAASTWGALNAGQTAF